MPSGTAITTAPTVTNSEPTSSGSSPKIASMGYQRTRTDWRSGNVKKGGQPLAQQKEKDQGDDDYRRDAGHADDALDDEITRTASAALGDLTRSSMLQAVELADPAVDWLLPYRLLSLAE
jgi:hypothetical protein